MATEEFTIQIAQFMGKISTLLDNMSSTINRMPESNSDIKSNFYELKSQITQINSILTAHIKDKEDANEEILKSLSSLIEAVKKNDGSVSLQNKETLTKITKEICDDSEFRKHVEAMGKIALEVKEVMDTVTVLLREKDEKVKPGDIIELIKFAKTGNKIIEWIVEKKKALIFVAALAGAVATFNSWWPKIQKILEVLK